MISLSLKEISRVCLSFSFLYNKTEVIVPSPQVDVRIKNEIPSSKSPGLEQIGAE